MKIASIREHRIGEARAALSPEMARKYIEKGFSVSIEAGTGAGSAMLDQAYADVGVKVVVTAGEALQDADIVLTVAGLDPLLATRLKPGALLIGMLGPYERQNEITAYAHAGITALSLELLPRISRAQSMDVLSSQANLAGYRAVIDAVASLGKAVPMMMTAAGTVAAARVLIMGAGVAGLQAIATARRLGAIVSAFDVRAAAKEQVESLGAKFIEVPAGESGEGAGGYAKEMSEDYKRKQGELVHETLKKQDIAITTALIPGKRAPLLITEQMVKDMRPGSVIVDLAAAQGGNCELTKPDEIVEAYGVAILGYTNMPSRTATDATQLYARNLFHFISLMLGKEGFAVPWEDELIKATLLTKDGGFVHPLFLQQAA